jgi:hypothetical protein
MLRLISLKLLPTSIDKLTLSIPAVLATLTPVFWTPNVKVVEQKIVGKGHLKLTLSQDNQPVKITAVAWRWGEYFPLPSASGYRLQTARKQLEWQYNQLSWS